jgi:hypothetical protein
VTSENAIRAITTKIAPARNGFTNLFLRLAVTIAGDMPERKLFKKRHMKNYAAVEMERGWCYSARPNQARVPVSDKDKKGAFEQFPKAPPLLPHRNPIKHPEKLIICNVIGLTPCGRSTSGGQMATERVPHFGELLEITRRCPQVSPDDRAWSLPQTKNSFRYW